MTILSLENATQPTIYFIGVSTNKSSIMKIFPKWAKRIGLNAAIRGIDIKIHADPEIYREVVNFIKNDPMSMGALITTHKIDLYNAAKDLFDYLDPYALMFGELSSISKRNGKLRGHAKDPISSGLAMEAFIPKNFWKKHGGQVFIMGAGGSARAIGAYLLDKNKGYNIPSRIIVSNRSKPRLIEMEKIINMINPDVPAEYHLAPEPEINDQILERVKEYSLIVNATGLGKDRIGSPLTDACNFPKNSLIWELNYRGDLRFMHQALKQKNEKSLYVEDGWIYFIHGWTLVIAEVFDIDITGEVFHEFEKAADEVRSGT